MVFSLILWYLTITLLGWICFPLVYRLMPALKDHGYSISRALGLLLWSYLFWLLASLGILRNDAGGLMFAFALVAVLSAWTLRPNKLSSRIHLIELIAWLRSQIRLILSVELLFLITFVGWAVVRAANPEAIGTEKPMELAFINAILRSPTFPPHDPWLSGYAISYYYFGYVMVAMLAKITTTSGGVAFNLGVSMVFALSAIGSYGLIYDLLNKCFEKQQQDTARLQDAEPRFLFASLLSPLFVLIVSNLEGFLDVLHSRGVLWQRSASGELTSIFWKWLDIKDLNIPPQEPFSWVPDRFWWWWRASRVLQDYDLARNVKEIIDEFPFFSYLLADLHPHVLAMPFAFLAMTLAFNVFQGVGGGQSHNFHWRINLRTLTWVGTLAVPGSILLVGFGATRLSISMIGLGILGMVAGGFLLARLRHVLFEHGIEVLFRNDLGEITTGIALQLDVEGFLLASLALGGMAFLNTWDFPLYVALFAAAYALGRATREGLKLSEVVKDFVWVGLALGVFGGFLYLPFYLSFSSQVGGILPNLIYPTRGAHLWVMFAPLLIPIFTFLIYLINAIRTEQDQLIDASQREPTLFSSLKLALGIMICLWFFSLLLGAAIVMIPGIGEIYQSSLASSSITDLFQEAMWRRVFSPGAWLTLLVLLTLILGVLRSLDSRSATHSSEQASPEYAMGVISLPSPFSSMLSPPNNFVLLLILLGTLLVIGPEFIYLRDLFGWRMNTIFKFYFQTWLLWSIGAAYGSVVLLMSLRRFWGIAFSSGIVLLLTASLLYPALSLVEKTNGFNPLVWTLDSTAHLHRETPEEMAAIQWLQEAPPGVIAEAVPAEGGSYTQYGRVSMLSGLPAVLGWVGHENQWRGGNQIIGSRQGDLERLYCSRDWSEAKTILDQYHIRYIFVSNLERVTYTSRNNNCPLGLVDSKFPRNLNTVFELGPVTIYEYNSLSEE